MNKYIAFATLMILTNSVAFSQRKAVQDTAYNQKVVLEREFNPVFKDASRIDMLPQLMEPKNEKSPIQYQYSNLSTQLPVQWKTVAPEKKLDRYNFAHSNGFFNFGLGLPSNSLLNGGVTLLDDEINLLNFSIDHRAISDRRTPDGASISQKVYSSDTRVQFDFSRPFQKINFSASAAFTHSEFNYFGQGNPDLHSYLDLFFLPISTNQVHNVLNMSAQASTTTDDDILYKAAVSYNYFGKQNDLIQHIKGPTEHLVTIDGGISKKLTDNRRIAFDFNLYDFIYSLDPSKPAYDFAPKTYGLMSVRPHYDITGEGFNLSAGVNGEFVLNNGMRLHLAPAVSGKWEFAPNYFLLGDLTGGTQIRSFANTDAQVRYLIPSYRLNDTYTTADGHIRLKTNIVPRLEMELNTGFKSGDEYYFTTQNYFVTNFIAPIALTNTQQYSAGFSAKYELKDRGDIQLQLNKYSYRLKEFNPNINDKNIAWDKPTFEMMLDANIRINEKITTQLEYRLATGRYGLVWDDSRYVSKPMNAINLLNLNGRYQINNRWSAFAQLNNILLQKYDLWAGMPAQNFNFVIGTGFSY